MKNKRVRLLVIVLGSLAALLLIVALALPLLIDVNRYRGLIEEQAEAVMGRDVRLGEMSLSILPLGVKVEDVGVAALPEEGGGDLIAVRSLRVGARLRALLSKRLEVTAVTLDQPVLILERGEDGTWNVERLIPPEDPSAATSGEAPAAAPPVSVDRVRIIGGTVTLRDRAGGGPPRELSVESLDVTLKDLALDREAALRLSATVAGAELTLEGTVGPIQRPAGAPLEVRARVAVEGIAAGTVRDLASSAGVDIPRDLLNESTLGLELQGLFSSGGDGPTEVRVKGLTLRGLDLTLVHGADGSWNFSPLLGSEEGAAAASSEAVPTASSPPADLVLEVSDVEIAGARVQLVDESSGLDLAVEDVTLTLGSLPTESAAPVALAAGVELQGERVAGLDMRGTLGPIVGDAAPVDLSVALSEVQLSALASFLQEDLGVGVRSGSLDLDLKVSGTLLDDFRTSGTLEVRDAEASVPNTDGGERRVALDVSVSGDVQLTGRGERVEFRTLDLTVAGNRIGLSGTLDRSGPLTEVDIRLSPTRIRAEDLAGLLALAAFEAPVAFASDSPIEIEGRVQGEIGGETYPSVEGRLGFKGFSFRHPSMDKPLEEVQGIVELRGDRIEISGFGARVGNSDIGGTLSLQDFHKPRIRFAMQSRKADFWELMSFADGGEARAEPAAGDAPAGEQGGFLADVLAEGTLKIAEGSFQTLDFTDLDAGMKLEGQKVTLKPFRMNLYEGSFQGAAELDLAQDPPAFGIRADVDRLDVNGILADNLDLDGMISGRFRASLEARGAGTDYESVVRSLAGGGSVLVTQGAVGALDILGMLSEISGVFGEETLQSLSRQMATEGTSFDRLAATLRLGGNGMSSDDLVLESPAIVVQGRSEVDLLASTLDGEFDVVFSPQVSRSMRAEKSRAAQAFWDPSIDQVLLPMTVSGPVDAPTPSIDWSDAAENVARRQLEKEVGKRLGGLGGLASGGDAGQGSTSRLAPSDAPDRGGASAAGGDLVAEISRVRWGGSVLVKDLKIEGVVRGSNISHATLVIADAAGRKRERTLDEVTTYFAAGVERSAPATIRWDFTVDGKDLARAQEPFTVILTLHDTEGRSVETRTEARR